MPGTRRTRRDRFHRSQGSCHPRQSRKDDAGNDTAPHDHAGAAQTTSAPSPAMDGSEAPNRPWERFLSRDLPPARSRPRRGGAVRMSDAYEPMFGRPVGPWRRWWAWYPVRSFDGWWLWLRPVWARRIQSHTHLPGPMTWWWQYRGNEPDHVARRGLRVMK